MIASQPSQAAQGVLSRHEVAGQLRALGVEKGGVLLVHTSFQIARPIEGGPLGLVEALRAALGPMGALVMPSWTGDDDERFDPATTPASPELGVVPDAFRRLPRTACRGKTGTRFESTTERTTIVALGSPSRTSGCGDKAYSPKGSWGMLARGSLARGTSWSRSNTWLATRCSSSILRARGVPSATRREGGARKGRGPLRSSGDRA